MTFSVLTWHFSWLFCTNLHFVQTYNVLATIFTYFMCTYLIFSTDFYWYNHTHFTDFSVQAWHFILTLSVLARHFFLPFSVLTAHLLLNLRVLTWHFFLTFWYNLHFVQTYNVLATKFTYFMCTYLIFSIHFYWYNHTHFTDFSVQTWHFILTLSVLVRHFSCLIVY